MARRSGYVVELPLTMPWGAAGDAGQNNWKYPRAADSIADKISLHCWWDTSSQLVRGMEMTTLSESAGVANSQV